MPFLEKRHLENVKDFSLVYKQKDKLLNQPMNFTADKIEQTIEEIKASKASSSRGGRQGRIRSFLELD